jgi:outer membrane receptor protein involved in Fe transport
MPRYRAGLVVLAGFIELFVAGEARAQSPADPPPAAIPVEEAPAAPTPEEGPFAIPVEPASEWEEGPEFYDDLDTVAVTGVTRTGATCFQSSVSVSDLSASEIRDLTPRTTAEIFRNLPGFRSESSGGEGNANIQVRGLPVTTSGAKFVQLQEDGLPVLSFGDIAFGNADNFLRADTTVARIEAIRGGSASTAASNAPGAIINFLSKTGEVQGGSFGLIRGVDFDTTRVDFEYGQPVANDTYLHFGGFFRTGEGARDAGYNAESGGQIKANLTRAFRNGHIRLFFKHLDDRTIPYLPSPVAIVDGRPSPVDDYDARTQTLSSPNLLTNTRINGGELELTSVRDGMRSLSTSVGTEAVFDLPDDWTLSNRMRYAANRGGFVGSFTSGVLDAGSAAAAYGGSGLEFANGARAAQRVQEPATLNGNGLLAHNLLYDVQLHDLGQFVNDLQLRRRIDSSVGTFDLSAGYYKSLQRVHSDWSSNTYLQEISGTQPSLIDVVGDDGDAVTVNGVSDFGTFDPLFDLTFDRNALYGAVVWSKDWFTLDASLRYDNLAGTGSSNLGSPTEAVGGFVTKDIDVNGDGLFQAAETGIGTVDATNLFKVDYAVDYLSYSIGAGAEASEDVFMFGRFSHGGVGNGDRLVRGGTGFTPSGNLAADGLGVDLVNQAEMGVKARTDDGVIPGYVAGLATAFYSDTEESTFEVVSERAIDRTSRAFGLELEGVWRMEWLVLTGGLTLTDAKITSDNLNLDNVGNTPRRQAAAVYQLAPAFAYLDHSAGFSLVGTSKSYAQDDNELVLPGFAQLNLFANIEVAPGLVASVNMNNATNSWGLTEAEEAALPDSGIIRARTISGRTTSLALRYVF